MRRLTTEQFIEKAQEKHGDVYDYSGVVYTRACDKVILGCKTHGFWEQRPNDHLTGNGCPACKFDKIASMKRSNVSEFVNKAISVHGPTYDYSSVVYKNAITKVEIKCGEHGTFSQTPDKHLAGTGCPKCSNGISRGERKIQQWLDKNDIIYEREKIFNGLHGATKNSRLRYDFFLPDRNMLLEYDGEQHFNPVRTKGRLSPSEAVKKHKATVKNDKKKTEYATKNGYNLLRISFNDYNNIESILEDQV